MHKIDAHIHFAADDDAMRAIPERLDLKMLNICVSRPGWRDKQAALYQRLARQDPEHFAWCTTFDLPALADPGFDPKAYADRIIAELDRDFAAGAVACKIWKNVGMELKDAAGRFALPDDPLFDPIYAHLAQKGWTLLAHIAEPLACWQPLDPASPHYGYYSKNPQWHMLNRPDVPAHGTLMDARDNIMKKHPTLRLVGAHLGSLEFSLEEIATRLDRYPNFAVDTSARLGDIARFSTADLRAFIDKYQDRILWSTDIVVFGRQDAAGRAAFLDWVRDYYATEDAFYAGNEPVEVNRNTVDGLALPQPILDKICVSNAQRWYPGL